MLDLLRNFSSSFRKNQKVEAQSYYLFTLSVSIGLISCSAIAMCLVHTICSPVQQKESSSHRRNFRLISPRVCIFWDSLEGKSFTKTRFSIANYTGDRSQYHHTEKVLVQIKSSVKVTLALILTHFAVMPSNPADNLQNDILERSEAKPGHSWIRFSWNQYFMAVSLNSEFTFNLHVLYWSLLQPSSM